MDSFDTYLRKLQKHSELGFIAKEILKLVNFTARDCVLRSEVFKGLLTVVTQKKNIQKFQLN